jgi:hypothetical protein
VNRGGLLAASPFLATAAVVLILTPVVSGAVTQRLINFLDAENAKADKSVPYHLDPTYIAKAVGWSSDVVTVSTALVLPAISLALLDMAAAVSTAVVLIEVVVCIVSLALVVKTLRHPNPLIYPDFGGTPPRTAFTIGPYTVPAIAAVATNLLAGAVAAVVPR